MRAVRFARAKDGTALAWTRSGSGPTLVKASNWLTHLEYDTVSPVWSHWIELFESQFDFIRYDERGCGMSDRVLGEIDENTWRSDLEAIVDMAELEEPFYLLGISQGCATAISYAVAHPERVAGLILYGGYARGVNHRDPAERELFEATVQLMRLGWDDDNPAFRQVFTSTFIPDGNAEQHDWYNTLLQKTVTPENAAQLFSYRQQINVEPLLSQINVPTLIIHVGGDKVTNLRESEILAREISGAEFLVFEGTNHIVQENEPAWDAIKQAVTAFAKPDQSDIEQLGLTAREAEILRLICRANSNKEIAREVDLADKTVRNHATNILPNLRVTSRQEAILRFGDLFA